jgi:uncharacterized protein YndB with AHSA1/START domain
VAADAEPIRREIFIPARPKTVFRFLVEPELIGRWIGRARFVSATEGGLFCLQFTFGHGHTATGVFTEVAPPRRVAFSFGWDGSETFPPGASHVEIELRPHGEGTLVRVTHSGLPAQAEPPFDLEDHAARWSDYLLRLRLAVGPPRTEDASIRGGA